MMVKMMCVKGEKHRRGFGWMALPVMGAALFVTIISTLAPVALAGQATAATYPVPCTTTSSSFNQGTTVYGGGASISNGNPTVDVLYVNPTGGVARDNTPVTVSGGAACDSTGYPLPANAPTGTWTLEICKVGTSCTGGGNPTIATTTFTVNAAVPEFPFGAVAILVPFIAVYLMARGRVNIGKNQ